MCGAQQALVEIAKLKFARAGYKARTETHALTSELTHTGSPIRPYPGTDQRVSQPTPRNPRWPEL